MPVVPLCPDPKLKVPEVELVPGVALSPKPPLPAGAAEPPKVNGDGAELPQREPLPPLWVVCAVAVAPKPDVVADPNENTDVVLPKAGWVLAGVPKVEAAAFKPPKAGCAAALPKAAAAGAADAAEATELPKVKELPKLGASAGLVAPSVAPNVGCGLAPGYVGSAGLALELKGMLKAGVTVLLKVSVGWLVVAGAEVEVVRALPKPLKPPLLLAAVWAEPARDWLKEVPAADAAGARGLPNWKMEARAGAELEAVTGGAPPNRSDGEVEAGALLEVLAEVLTPKPNPGFEAEAVVPEATVEVAVPKPVKRGVDAAVVVAGAVVCFKEKGVDRGMAENGSTLSKMGLKMGAAVLAAVEGAVLDAATVAAEELVGKGLSLSLLGVAGKMGLNMGEAQAGPGVAREEELAGALSIPNSMLGFGVGEGAVEAGVLTDCSAWETAGDLVSVSGVVDEAEASPRKVAAGLESEELLAWGPVSGETRGARRLGVFGGEGAAMVAASAGSGKRRK